MHDTSPATAQAGGDRLRRGGRARARRSCERLARDGFAVATCDLAPADGSALHAELDVADAARSRAFVARVEAELGPLDVVVTAAGIQRTGASETRADGRLAARASTSTSPAPGTSSRRRCRGCSSAAAGGS